MRDSATLQPLGTTLLRKMFLIVTTLVVMIFSYLALSHPVSAVTTYDATWAEGSLTYKGNTYTGPTAPVEGHDIPDGSHLYSYLEDNGSKWNVIYFPADTDFTTVKEGTFVTYTRINGLPSNKSTPQTITIDPSTGDEANRPTDETSTSCKIDGVGWFVCSGTNFLASGMDWVFHILAGFVEVRPLSTESNSVMHRVWDIMRSFANVAFVIAFIIIIYSQLTSFGVSNYGIKKLLPRLILAAIFVNVSYWICVVAIDISNILGDSLQKVFMNLRDMVVGSGGGNGWQLVSWESVASFILSGGAIIGAGVTGLYLASTTLAAFSVGGVALLLAPILLGAFLTVLVVLFILAARQAIITLLVIIAPLAMVAYLLPNTEKWFDKWRGLFMTMLIFFPAFSLVFGAAQFAGLMIIQNADDINTILLGMAVQIAPLAITPLLLKLSGSLLGKVAGIINDPSRGFKDRAKNWSRERLEQNRAKNLAQTREMAKKGTLGRRHVMRRTAMNADTRKRVREGQKSVHESASDNFFNDSSSGHLLDTAKREVEREKNRIHNTHESHWNIKAKIDPESLEKELEVRITADEANLSKARLDSVYEEIKAGNSAHFEQIHGYNHPNTGPQENSDAARRIELLNRAADTTAYLAVEGMRKNEADRKQRSNVSNMLHKNEEMVDGKNILEYAAGIGNPNMLEADTVSKVRKEFVENRDAQSQLMAHYKLDSEQYQDLALKKKDVTITDSAGVSHTFKKDDDYAVEAALEQQKVAASFSQKLAIVEASGKGGILYNHRDTVQDVAKSMTGAAPFANDKSLNAVIKGEYKGRESTVYHSIRQIYEGRIKSEAVSTANNAAMDIIYDAGKDKTAIENFFKTTIDNPAASTAERAKLKQDFYKKMEANYSELKHQAFDILHEPTLRKNANKELLEVLEKNQLPRRK